jgi:GT2 family glycosyltransferase
VTEYRGRVAILTPTLEGREHLLAECVASVKAQTYRSCVHFVQMGERGDGGPAAIRNQLAAGIRADWLLFLDDDDLLDPCCVTTLVKLAGDYDVVYPWCRVMGRNWNPNAEFDADALRRSNFIPVTALVRKSAFDAVGGFPLDWECEDWGLWLALLDAGARFRCVPHELWTYRFDHGGNRSLAVT